MYLFFLYGSRAPRDLHSFPTRRSSDLDGTGSDRNAEHDKLTDDPPVAPRGATGGSSVSLSCSALRSLPVPSRSEERRVGKECRSRGAREPYKKKRYIDEDQG